MVVSAKPIVTGVSTSQPSCPKQILWPLKRFSYLEKFESVGTLKKDEGRFFHYRNGEAMVIVAGVRCLSRRYSDWWIFTYDFITGQLSLAVPHQKSRMLVPVQTISDEDLAFTVSVVDGHEEKQMACWYSMLTTPWTVMGEIPADLEVELILGYGLRIDDSVFMYNDRFHAIMWNEDDEKAPLISTLNDHHEVEQNECSPTLADEKWGFPEENAGFYRLLMQVTSSGVLLAVRQKADAADGSYHLWLLDLGTKQWKLIQHLRLQHENYLGTVTAFGVSDEFATLLIDRVKRADLRPVHIGRDFAPRDV